MCFGRTCERTALFFPRLTASEGGFGGHQTGCTFHELCMMCRNTLHCICPVLVCIKTSNCSYNFCKDKELTYLWHMQLKALFGICIWAIRVQLCCSGMWMASRWHSCPHTDTVLPVPEQFVTRRTGTLVTAQSVHASEFTAAPVNAALINIYKTEQLQISDLC